MIGRRDAGLAIIASGLGLMPGFAAAEPNRQSGSTVGKITRNLVTDFYQIMNSGSWEFVSNVLSDDVRMRSNILYQRDESRYETGGSFLGKTEVLDFLKSSRSSDSTYWDSKPENWSVTPDGYLLAWAAPMSKAQGCHGISRVWERPLSMCFGSRWKM